MDKVEADINKRREKIKKWLGDHWNIALVLLVAFTIIIKLYYFYLAANQPTWWDEGDYLALAKVFAAPFPETPEWWSHFSGIRPLLMPAIWAFFIKFNISEAIMRFVTEVVPSILLTIYTYLLGKSLFNKKVGIIAGYMTAVYWVIQFYGIRFMTDIPAMMFAIMGVYYFWEYYEKNNRAVGLYLCIFLGVLGFLTRFPTALVTFGVLLFLLITRRTKFFTDIRMWIAGGVGVATLIPYFLYNKISQGSFFPALSFYSSGGTVYNSPAWMLFGYVWSFIGNTSFAILIIGLAYSIFMMFAFADVIFKRKSKAYDSHLLLLCWVLFQIFYFVFIIRSGSDRWILLWMTPVFIYIGLALDLISDYADKYYKYAGIIIIILFVIIAGNFQINQGDSLIRNKLNSYQDVKDTGLWLRDNTPPSAKIMGASIVQNAYYSQRRTYDFYIGTELRVKEVGTQLDPQGRVIDVTYTDLRNETELNCKIDRIKPDYLVVHVCEPVFTPNFMYDYADRHPELLTPVKTFSSDGCAQRSQQGQITAIIYKFDRYPVINESQVNCTWVYDRSVNATGLPLSITDPARLIIPS